jgi:general stress protein 26
MAENTLETFWSLIRGSDVCMMTTRDSNALHARPMIADIDEAMHEFRFITRLSTHKVGALAAHPDVNLAFSDAEAGNFVSISGQAYLTRDRTLIDQLWSSAAEAYFECGRDDSDIAVIRVVPAIAENWDRRGTLRQTWNLFKAKASDSELALRPSRKLAFG